MPRPLAFWEGYSVPPPVLLVKVLEVTSLLTPFLMAMAFTVVVLVRVSASL